MDNIALNNNIICVDKVGKTLKCTQKEIWKYMSSCRNANKI